MSLNQLIEPLVPLSIDVQNVLVNGNLEVDGSAIFHGATYIKTITTIFDFTGSVIGHVYVVPANKLLNTIFVFTGIDSSNVSFQLPAVSTLVAYLATLGITASSGTTYTFQIVNQSQVFVELKNGGDTNWTPLVPDGSSFFIDQAAETEVTYTVIFGTSGLTATLVVDGQGSANPPIPSLNNGQLPIGRTGLPPIAGTLTEGASGNIDITNASGSITIDLSASPIIADLTLIDASNQILLAPTLGIHNTTISVPAPGSGNRIYTVPDAGSDTTFVMGAGVQTISGTTNISSLVLPAPGGTSTPITAFETSTFATTVGGAGGPIPSTAVTFTFTKLNQLIFINYPATFANGNNISSALTTNTAIPSRFRPSVLTQCAIDGIFDVDNPTGIVGFIEISNTGFMSVLLYDQSLLAAGTVKTGVGMTQTLVYSL